MVSSGQATQWVFKCVTLPQSPAIKYISVADISKEKHSAELKHTHFSLRPCPSFLTRPKLISFFVSFRLFFSWLTMAFTRAAVTCNIIVRSRGSLNWISNLIKHLTLDHGPLIPLPRPSGCDGSNMAERRVSRKLIRVLVIISHAPMSVVTGHTAHNQPSSRYPGLSEDQR